MVVATPISPRKPSVVIFTSTVIPLSRQARPARFRCVSLLPAPSALRRPFASTQLTENVQIAAGIVSLLNDYMIKTRPADVLPDRAPLGFLNPWLYSDEVRSVGGLTDITAGSNPGCGTPGFEARAGWDPVRPATLVSRKFRRGLITNCAP